MVKMIDEVTDKAVMVLGHSHQQVTFAGVSDLQVVVSDGEFETTPDVPVRTSCRRWCGYFN